MTDFIEQSEKYTSGTFENLDINEILSSAISGKIDNTKLWTGTLKIFGKELQNAITILGSIILIIIINSILNCITEGLENKSISQIAFYVQYILIVTIVLTNFSDIVSKISNKVQIDRLAKRLKSSTIWIIGVILTLFVTLVSVDGTLSSSVDAVTSKTAKAAVSNLIPVVGKILGDAVDSVIGCSSILKNAVGIVGVIIILAISIGPIIKLLLFMAIYYIGAAICEPIADEKVVKLLDTMGDTFKILLGLMFSMSTMIIIGTTLIVKISNSGSIT